MRALRLESPGKLAAVDIPPPGLPGPGEALAAVRRIGVCGTDLHAFSGNQPFFSYPRILGHELGVEVLAVGDGVEGLARGDRCSVEPYMNCGRCIACRRGRPNCCASLRVLGVHADGGMTEQIVVPARKLHRSRALSFEQLALIETLAIGCHAVDRARLAADEFVLVVGAGPIGLSVIQFALEAASRVIVLDVNAGRLAFCGRQLGVSHLIDGSREDPAGALARITGGDMPTAVFDATGSPKSMMASFHYPSNAGRLIYVGLFQGDVAFNDPSFHRRELDLLASRNSLPADFGRIISLVESGRIDTSPWVTHRATLEGAAGLFPSWTRPESGVIKAMIEV